MKDQLKIAAVAAKAEIQLTPCAIEEMNINELLAKDTMEMLKALPSEKQSVVAGLMINRANAIGARNTMLNELNYNHIYITTHLDGIEMDSRYFVMYHPVTPEEFSEIKERKGVILPGASGFIPLFKSEEECVAAVNSMTNTEDYIVISVFIPTIDFEFLQKRTDDLSLWGKKSYDMYGFKGQIYYDSIESIEEDGNISFYKRK